MKVVRDVEKGDERIKIPTFQNIEFSTTFNLLGIASIRVAPHWFPSNKYTLSRSQGFMHVLALEKKYNVIKEILELVNSSFKRFSTLYLHKQSL